MTQLRLLLPIMIALIIVTGCSNDEPAQSNPVEPVIELSRAEETINQGINNFGFDIFNAVAANKEITAEYPNFAISPLSLVSTLSMCANTLDEDFSDRICNAINANDLDDVNSFCRKIRTYLTDKGNACQTSVVNSVWHRKDLIASEAYISRIDQFFHGSVTPIDFTAPDAADQINRWAADNTNYVITNIVKQDDILGSIIFLANAISFKGIWYKPFEVSKTTKSTFHALSGDCQTEFMNISTELKYYKNSDFESVSVSLKGWFEFIAVLPSESKSVSDFSQSFNSTVFDEIKGRLALYDVDLSIHKFHENFKMTCSEIFRAIGLDVNIQNFEGFNPRYINRDELRLKVDHFTDINVDEEGASVTSVSTGNVGSVAPSVFGEASVTFDRPFIYLIRNTKTGSIIMMGQYTQPQ